MIKKSLVMLIFLLSFYGVGLWLFGDLAATPTETYDEANQRIAKTYLDGNKIYERVIVGSSIASMLSSETLGDDTYNMSFVGRSALDGLYLLDQSSNLPGVVAVEINVIDRLENVTFTRSLTGPLSNIFSIPRHLKPVELFASSIGKLSRKQLRQDESVPSRDRSALPTEQVAEAVVEKNIGDWQKTLPFEKNLDQLSEYLQRFQAKGATVVFFEMPMHSEIENSPKATWIRDRVRERFPDVEIIREPASSAYETNDGLHLIKESGIRFSHFFSEELDRLLKVRETDSTL